MIYLWRKKKSSGITEEQIMRRFGLSPVIAKCISFRLGEGCSESDMEDYLNPELERLHDPFLLDGMKKAVEIILKTVKDKGKIIVYGDYDVDGITATALMIKTLRSFGGNADWFIPNRIEDGYGLNCDSVKTFVDKGYALMITVDCGISAADVIKTVKNTK